MMDHVQACALGACAGLLFSLAERAANVEVPIDRIALLVLGGIAGWLARGGL